MATAKTDHPHNIFPRVYIFFGILFLSCIIADGPQTGSDIFWPIVTLACIPLWEMRERIGWHSRTDLLLWIALIGSLVVSTITSWSPGYSVSSILRILIGLIWMKRFTRLSTKEQEQISVAFSVVGVSIFIVSILAFFLRLPWPLPAFSLIGRPAGHFPFVYLTLPVVPIVFYATRNQLTPLYRMLYIAVIVSIIVSFSRAALICSVLFLWYITVTATLRKSEKILTIGTIVLFMGLLTILFWFTTGSLPQYIAPPIPAALQQYMVKNPLAQDQRLSFIREGFATVRTTPFLGTGPDTFALVSKRFAITMYDASTYAHNIMLELLTETGFVGMSIIGMIFGYYLFVLIRLHPWTHMNRQEKNTFYGFTWAFIFILALAFVEPVLNHYPIFIVFMMLVGLGMGYTRKTTTHQSASFTPILVVLAIYAVSWIGSDIAALHTSPTIAYLMAPYRESTALRLLQSSAPLTKKATIYIRYFHPRSERIDLAFADRAAQTNDWNYWITNAMYNSPSDTSIQISYLSTLAATTSPIRTCTAIRTMTQSPDLPCMDEASLRLFQRPEYLNLIPLWNGLYGRSKFLYAVGRTLLTTTNETVPNVISLWTRARDLAPQWGYFHIELASLIADYNKDATTAIPTLLTCLSDPYASTLCTLYLHDLTKLPKPGSLKPEIIAIPQIIDAP